MIKIWGRKTSSNVQKAMWAVGELNLEHERIGIRIHQRAAHAVCVAAITRCQHAPAHA